ncbi:hypothetical protein [Tepidibacillus decaturensis]|uniref:Uncharacterized protein n=1 Tax=Tepidibacillus decaturensis TaxID=1413211 RepID=A0A135L121_9BACI|nr:hypothetical protein [Tepidibacillus decaturensis]KXG42690.1 hypothetical protein U473_00490 [Tepidibacillus decaturensis]
MEMDKINKALKLIEASASITGSAVGVAAGGLLAGPPGAFAGALAGASITEILKYIGSEMYDRKLSMGEREMARIGAALVYSIEKIHSNVMLGLRVREDDFFSKTDKSKLSKAEELLEGTLSKAKSCYEEKKVKYIGNIYGNLPFFAFIDSYMAYQLINFAERLTYRQLCIMAMIKKIEEYNLSQEDYRGSKQINVQLAFLLREIVELMDLNLGHVIQKNNTDSEVIFGLTDISPGRLRLNPLGNSLYLVMSLDEIEDEDINRVVSLFR